MRFPSRTPIRWAVAGVAAGALLAGGALALADIPDGGTVTACYQASGGQLRVIDASAGGSCTRKERPLSWRQSAPTLTVTTRTSSFTVDPNIGTIAPGARCLAGERVTGGGYDLSDPRLTVDRSMPNGQTGGWDVQVHNPQLVTASSVVYVLCARLS